MGLDWERAIFNQPDWPKFRWNAEVLARDLSFLTEEEKLLSNQLNYLDEVFLNEFYKISLYEELINSFYLEDEFIDPEAVKSVLAHKSLVYSQDLRARHLGYGYFRPPADLIDNYINLYLEARAHSDKRLSSRRLKRWSQALAQPGSLAGLGSFRSASYGLSPARPSARPYALVPLPAPAADKLAWEMGRFLNWHNAPWSGDLVIKAGISQLWLLIVQPFLVGSDRLARLAADLTLTSRGKIAHFYSLSRITLLDRAQYHQILVETILQPDLDITPWLAWFIRALRQAARVTNGRFDRIINQAVHWAKTQEHPLTKRPKNVLALLWTAFIDPLTPERYAQIAQRDPLAAEMELNDLVANNLVDPKFLARPAQEPKPGFRDQSP
jgi:Fic family protein